MLFSHISLLYLYCHYWKLGDQKINLNVGFVAVSRAGLYSLQVGEIYILSLLSLLEAGRPEDKLECTVCCVSRADLYSLQVGEV